MDPSEKEQEKKQGVGWEGGITDNILFNYCLNKNIVFLKERNQFKSNKTREKRNELQTSYLQEQTRKQKTNRGKGTWEIQEKKKTEDKTSNCDK